MYRYFAGKADWLASGLPSEGELTSEPRIGALAERDVATCRLDQRIGDIRPKNGLCVVVNDQNVVLGDLRGKALEADPSTPVGEVMNPAPSTYRPNVSVHEMAHTFAESGARRVLVSDGDGHLIGVLSREAVEAQLRSDGPILALSTHQGGNHE